MRKIIWILLIAVSLQVKAQKYPQYSKPLSYSPILVSTFGELRPGHFHSGLDFSTGARQGIPVYALDSGYVSRIKVSPDGYGNALYVTYYNGYKSVYGHLRNYATFIDTFVRSQQYWLETFELAIYPGPDELPVKKGQILGYVGNTGRSYAPHLHFEMRTTYRDRPVNPLFFGLDIKDHTPPRIFRIGVYPASDSSLVQGRHSKYIFSAYSRKSPVRVQGPVYFAVEAYDYTDKHHSRKGVYSVELFVDDSLFFAYSFDSLDFYTTRYVNTLLDYAEYKKHKIKLQRSYISPNNKLNIYKTANNGVVLLEGRHKIKYVVRDYYGNSTSVSFAVEALRNSNYRYKPSPRAVKLEPLKENYISKEGFELYFPAYSLYDTVYLQTEVIDRDGFSPLYVIGNDRIPLQSPFTISVKRDVDSYLESKIVMVYSDSKGKKDVFATVYKDGKLIGQADVLGKFWFEPDTVPPVVTAQKLSFSPGQQISLKIKDDLSGIADYDCYLNGRWILFAYDAKSDRLYATVDTNFVSGENKLLVEAWDNTGNKSVYNFTITVK